jgi:hypothetical protein
VFGVFLNHWLHADSVQCQAIFLAMIFYSMIIIHYSILTLPAYPLKICQEPGKETMVVSWKVFSLVMLAHHLTIFSKKLLSSCIIVYQLWEGLYSDLGHASGLQLNCWDRLQFFHLVIICHFSVL